MSDCRKCGAKMTLDNMLTPYISQCGACGEMQ